MLFDDDGFRLVDDCVWFVFERMLLFFKVEGVVVLFVVEVLDGWFVVGGMVLGVSEGLICMVDFFCLNVGK